MADHSRANILVLENKDQLRKIESFQDDLEYLETVIMFREEPELGSDVISWQQLLEVGRGVEDSVLRERLEHVNVHRSVTHMMIMEKKKIFIQNTICDKTRISSWLLVE